MTLESLSQRRHAFESIGYQVAFLALTPIVGVSAHIGGDFVVDHVRTFLARADDLGGGSIYNEALSNVIRISHQLTDACDLRMAAKRIHQIEGHARRIERQTAVLAEVLLPTGKRGIIGAVNGGSRLSQAQRKELDELGVFIVRGGEHTELNILANLPAGSKIE